MREVKQGVVSSYTIKKTRCLLPMIRPALLSTLLIWHLNIMLHPNHRGFPWQQLTREPRVWEQLSTPKIARAEAQTTAMIYQQSGVQQWVLPKGDTKHKCVGYSHFETGIIIIPCCWYFLNTTHHEPQWILGSRQPMNRDVSNYQWQ